MSSELVQEENPEEKEEKMVNFDPDEDGFEFGIEKAFILHKNINLL
jgi:hypothetical protein